MTTNLPFPASGIVNAGGVGRGWVWMVQVQVPSGVSTQTFTVAVDGTTVATLTGAQKYGPIALVGTSTLTISGGQTGQDVQLTGNVFAYSPGPPLPPMQGGLVFNVLDYGADPTGVAPSASVVQKAANDLGAAGGGTLYGIGTFLLESPILLPSNCTVAGAGAGATTWKQGFAASGIDAQGVFENADTVAGNSFISFRDCTILCIPVTGASPNLSTSTCTVYFQGCSDVSFHNIVAQNGTLKGQPLPSEVNTPNVNTTGLNHRWHFSNVHGDSGAEGIYWQQGIGLVVAPDCIFTNSHDSTISVNSSGEQIIIGGILDKQGNVYDAEGCVELNNDGAGDTNGIRDVTVTAMCLNNGDASSQGLAATGVTGLRLDGCECRGNAGYGANIADCTDVGVGGSSKFDGNSKSGLILSAATLSGFSMAGGSAANNTLHGISYNVTTGEDIAIVGVNLRGNGTGGFEVFNPATRAHIAECVADAGGDFNTNGEAGWTISRCAPYNPVGPVTVAVPASGSPTTPVLPYDSTFYITQATAASSVAVQGQTIDIPIGGPTAIRVPAGETLTPTYTTAPTWVVMGE